MKSLRGCLPGGEKGAIRKDDHILLIYNDNNKTKISASDSAFLLQTPSGEPVCYMTCFISTERTRVFSVLQFKS